MFVSTSWRRIMDGMTMDTTYRSDEARWQAVQTRDEAAEGQFFYAVMTTGVFWTMVFGFFGFFAGVVGALGGAGL